VWSLSDGVPCPGSLLIHGVKRQGWAEARTAIDAVARAQPTRCLCIGWSRRKSVNGAATWTESSDKNVRGASA
jgi:hypothetical protein